MNEDDTFEKLKTPDIYEAKKILKENVWDIIGANGINSTIDAIKKVNDAIAPYQSEAIIDGYGDLTIVDKNDKHTTIMKKRDGYEMEIAKSVLNEQDRITRKELTEQGIRSQKKISKVDPGSRKGRRLWKREMDKFNEKLRKSLIRMDDATKIYIPFE